jgi:hypothetical protein
LGKSQAEKLIEARETLHLVAATMTLDATGTLGQRGQGHQLSKHLAATVHAPSPGISMEWRQGILEFKLIFAHFSCSTPTVT